MCCEESEVIVCSEESEVIVFSEESEVIESHQLKATAVGLGPAQRVEQTGD